MKNLQFLLFLVTLPAIAAIAHDLYLYYENQSEPFRFCDLGFIWTTYHPESYRKVVEALDPTVWERINKILTFRAFFAALEFAAVFYIFAGIFIIWQKAAVAASIGRERSISISGRDKIKQFQYKKRGGR